MLLGGALRDELRLRRARVGQVPLPLLDLLAEVAHLMEDLRVLPADALRRVDAVQEVVEVLGAEEDLDRAATAAVHVERAQPRRDPRLRDAQARARDPETLGVQLQVALDLRAAAGCALS